jgi:hypothetical protein
LLVFILRGLFLADYLARAIDHGPFASANSRPRGPERGEGRLMLFDIGQLPVFRNRTKPLRDPRSRPAFAAGASICRANLLRRVCSKDAG